MRVLTLSQFVLEPAGTVFERFEDDIFDEISLKGETTRPTNHDKSPHQYSYEARQLKPNSRIDVVHVYQYDLDDAEDSELRFHVFEDADLVPIQSQLDHFIHLPPSQNWIKQLLAPKP